MGVSVECADYRKGTTGCGDLFGLGDAFGGGYSLAIGEKALLNLEGLVKLFQKK